MKRTVIYMLAKTPLVVGESAIVVPLNHDSDLVRNGHDCITTPIVSIAPNGTTFSTRNSLYKLADIPDPEPAEEVKRELVRQH